MVVTPIPYAARRVVGQNRITKPVSVQILTRVIIPVVAAKPGTTRDVRPTRSRYGCCVPGVGFTIVCVHHILEVVVVDEVITRFSEINSDAVARNGVRHNRNSACVSQSDAASAAANRVHRSSCETGCRIHQDSVVAVVGDRIVAYLDISACCGYIVDNNSGIVVVRDGVLQYRCIIRSEYVNSVVAVL